MADSEDGDGFLSGSTEVTSREILVALARSPDTTNNPFTAPPPEPTDARDVTVGAVTNESEAAVPVSGMSSGRVELIRSSRNNANCSE